MELHYTSWFRGKKRTINDMTMEQARALHEGRKPYGIVLGRLEAPDAFLEINDSFLYVGFLDSLQREFMMYEFSESSPGRIFLREIQTWDYDGSTDTRIKTRRYRFAEDGRFGIMTVDLRTRDSETIEPDARLDVSNLWDDYPVFGDYGALLNQDRVDLSALPI